MKIQCFPLNLCLLILSFSLAVSGCNNPVPVTSEPQNDSEVELQDYLLAEDETWRPGKTYTVNGTLEIPPDVTLEILPGTTVKFGRDALVKVRGVLKVGTSLSQAGLDKQVYLTSNNIGPQPGDWKGILFDHTHGLESFLRRTVVEYATVALDIKTTSPPVVDCTFRLNKTAIALDGSNAKIQHNEILDNNIGISTIGRQTRPQIEKNNITKNETGIICENVQSIIRDNNLNSNIYALRLQVKFDLQIANNWWGTLVDEEIDRVILDANDRDIINKQVGTVYYQPIAETRIAEAGPRK